MRLTCILIGVMSDETPPGNIIDTARSKGDYHAWMLRIWREHDTSPWRLQLKEVHGREVFLFKDLPALIEYLTKQMQRDL